MTFALGKWHLVSTRECSGAGPFDNWPLGRGFNRFYGFLGACTNQFYPDLVCGNEYIQQPKMPSDGYHLSEDLADRAITYMGDLKSNDPNKPFFCYLSFGALHSPHQTPTEFIDLYKGVFDDGWDAYREEILKKQKELGIVPENTELCGDDRFSMRWDSFSEAQKRIFARYMESYAGFLTHTDAQIGRVLNYLKKIGQYENTLIVFMADNGASAEGTPYGSRTRFTIMQPSSFRLVSMKMRFRKLAPRTRALTIRNAGRMPAILRLSCISRGITTAVLKSRSLFHIQEKSKIKEPFAANTITWWTSTLP